jgi:hypothetical protein
VGAENSAEVVARGDVGDTASPHKGLRLERG